METSICPSQSQEPFYRTTESIVMAAGWRLMVGRGWKILAKCACPVSRRVEEAIWKKSTRETEERLIEFEAIRDKG